MVGIIFYEGGRYPANVCNTAAAVSVKVKVCTGFSVVDVGTHFESTASKLEVGEDAIPFIPTFLHLLKKWQSNIAF